MENQQYYNPAIQNRYPGYQDPGRGTTILILGILSLTILGLFAGIPAWVMGSKDLKGIRDGRIAFSAKSSTQVGMILGIISTALSALVFIGIIVALGAGIMLSSSSDGADDYTKKLTEDPYRAMLISECNTIALHAQQYYNMPSTIGGGDRSFIGFQDYMEQNMVNSLKRQQMGKISFENVGHESIVIVCTGEETGNDEVNPARVEIKVYPDRIEPAEVIN